MSEMELHLLWQMQLMLMARMTKTPTVSMLPFPLPPLMSLKEERKAGQKDEKDRVGKLLAAA